MTHLYSLICLSLGAVCYVISQKSMMGNLKWSTVSTGFWGTQSWMNKYKIENEFPIPAKNNWYTKLFVIKYKEKYWLSGSFLVFASDSYHFFQFLFLLLISWAIAVHTENVILWLLIYRCTFGVIFTIGYKLFAK
jgi:hypothetical protein